MTKQTSPFVLLGVGLMASLGYFYFGPKLFGSKDKSLTDSPFSPFPPGAAPQPQPPGSQGPPLPAVLPQGQPPMGPQTMMPPGPMPPVNNQPNLALQNGALPMSPQGMPPRQQGMMLPMKPNPNMMFSGATFPEDVGYGYGFPLTGF